MDLDGSAAVATRDGTSGMVNGNVGPEMMCHPYMTWRAGKEWLKMMHQVYRVVIIAT